MKFGARDVGALIAEGRRLAIDEALYLIIEACTALSRGQHYGGVRPSRVLISDDGRVTIGDVDLERALGEGYGYETPEAIAGTPRSRFRFRFREVRVHPKGVTTKSWGPIDDGPHVSVTPPTCLRSVACSGS